MTYEMYIYIYPRVLIQDLTIYITLTITITITLNPYTIIASMLIKQCDLLSHILVAAFIYVHMHTLSSILHLLLIEILLLVKF